MPRPIQAHIDLNALENNLHVARHATSSRIMAVIKANGYGHGLLRVAQALADADGFALLDIQDAIRLREAGYRQTILLLEGFFDATDLELLAEYKLTSVIHSPWQIAQLAAYPKRKKLDVWLKVNTGMNRLGFAPSDVAQALELLLCQRAVRDLTLMTHFAHADEARGIGKPLQLFNEIAADYRVSRSLANSAALLRYRATHGDWVRPGILLYGASPFADVTAAQLGLRPAMTLTSRIIAVQDLRSGDEIGYGALFRADRTMRVGIVACGYADGYPRHAPNGTPMLVAGQAARLLGRVSMDMLCVDLSALPDADVGSVVTLWGEGMPIEQVAQAAGTISYELMCALAARVKVVV
ncbi:MAG: alanine racemase [Gallionellaceae bacterium CG1_02_56_997]|nr:MAG: alanine racemase [Gallionellaceae bacterium CG1_02_56_997]